MDKNHDSLPTGCVLSAATAEGMGAIRKLVWSGRLDPTQLRWQQFWVIQCEGRIVACGQLRNFSGVQELGSLVVAQQWRDRGLGMYLAKHLIQQATEALYLECLGKRLEDFYTRLGFIPISWQEVPPSLKLKFGISQLAKILLRIPVRIMYFPKLSSEQK